MSSDHSPCRTHSTTMNPRLSSTFIRRHEKVKIFITFWVCINHRGFAKKDGVDVQGATVFRSIIQCSDCRPPNWRGNLFASLPAQQLFASSNYSPPFLLGNYTPPFLLGNYLPPFLLANYLPPFLLGNYSPPFWSHSHHDRTIL